MVLTGLVLILWLLARIFEKKRIVWNWGLFLGLLYFIGVLLSAQFGSYRNVLNGEGKPVIFYGAFRGDDLVTSACYAVLFGCFSSIRFKPGEIIPFCGEAVFVHFSVVILQVIGINILNLFPESLSVRTNYEFQGTLGNIDLTAGYLSLMLPVLFAPYLFGVGKLRWFTFICGLTGMITILVSRVDTGLIVLLIMIAGIGIIILLYPLTAKRGLFLLAFMFFLLAGDSFIRFPWYSKTNEYEIAFFHPGKTTAFLLLGVICLLMSRKKQKVQARKPIRRRSLILLLVSGGIISLLLIYLIPVPRKYSVLWHIREVLSGRARNSFGQYRWGVWKYSINLSRMNELFGTGPDTFYYAFRDYIKLIGEKPKIYSGYDFAHNAYLNILVCNGIPTMIAYILLNLFLCIHAFRSKHPYGIMLGLGLLCYCVFEFFVFSIFIVSPMAWTIRGIAAGITVNRKCNGADNDVELFNPANEW